MSSSGAFGGCFGWAVPDDSGWADRAAASTAPANGRQMIAVAQSQRGIRRTAYGGA